MLGLPGVELCQILKVQFFIFSALFLFYNFAVLMTSLASSHFNSLHLVAGFNSLLCSFHTVIPISSKHLGYFCHRDIFVQVIIKAALFFLFLFSLSHMPPSDPLLHVFSRLSSRTWHHLLKAEDSLLTLLWSFSPSSAGSTWKAPVTLSGWSSAVFTLMRTRTRWLSTSQTWALSTRTSSWAALKGSSLRRWLTGRGSTQAYSLWYRMQTNNALSS